jgi:hypothetical protein
MNTQGHRNNTATHTQHSTTPHYSGRWVEESTLNSLQYYANNKHYKLQKQRLQLNGTEEKQLEGHGEALPRTERRS